MCLVIFYLIVVCLSGAHQFQVPGRSIYFERHMSLRPRRSTWRNVQYTPQSPIKASSAGIETCVVDKFNGLFKSVNKVLDGRSKGIFLMNCLCVVFGSNAALLKV